MSKDKTKTGKKGPYIKGGVIPKNEFFAYCFGGFGQGMIYAVMSSFISDYYTNVLFLPHIFILLLMLLARVWDAINDPMMGSIVDHHTTKRGKMKPYIQFACFPIAILTFLMYWAPDGMSKQSLMIYCAFIYVLWGMSYTIGDVPFWGLPNVLTGNSEERGQQISFARTFNGVGSAIPTVMYLLIGYIMPGDDVATSKMKYLIMAITASVIGILFYFTSSMKVKERVIPPVVAKNRTGKSGLYRILHCKPLVLVIIMGVLSSGRYMMSAAAVHVSRYAFMGVNPNNIYLILQICSGGGMFISMLFMPLVMKKFDYKKIVILTNLVGAGASVVTTLVGWYTQNFYICAPFIFLQCVPLGVMNTISYAMICDSLDYMELETGYRDNGMGSACQGFINKLGNAIATAGISLVYILLKLDPSKIVGQSAKVSEAALLTTTQRFGMFSLITIIPGVSLLLCTIPVFFYNLSKKNMTEISKELNERRQVLSQVSESETNSNENSKY